MTTGRKLALASVLVACAIIYLAYLGAAESWQYYLTVDECLTRRFDAQRKSPCA